MDVRREFDAEFKESAIRMADSIGGRNTGLMK
jgi:hypothetical protein